MLPVQPITLDYARPRGKSARHPGDTLWILLITLFPVLVVAAAIGKSVAPMSGACSTVSRPAAARTDLSQMETALDLFRADIGRYPTSTEGLTALVSRPAGVSGWRGPYLKRDVPSDPWENPYAYSTLTPLAAPAGCQVTCAGPDGKVGTPDDISATCP
jgi:general secretion pathway protein G